MSEPLRSAGPRDREPVFNVPRTIVVIIALCVLLYLAQTYVLTADQFANFLWYLAFIPARFTEYDGLSSPLAWVTPITYSLLHGSFAHIALNLIWLMAFGSPLSARIGPARTMLFWIATSIAAALTHYAVYSTSIAPLVGASGVVSGMMGAAARFGFRRTGASNSSAFEGRILPIGVALRMRTVLTFLGVWFVTNIITGLFWNGPDASSSIAWEAHIGGFVVGFFGVSLFDRPGKHR